jgi:ornithine cyclodeaminase/alanine dehydrogenase-like protein (mu-crystallin family)
MVSEGMNGILKEKNVVVNITTSKKELLLVKAKFLTEMQETFHVADVGSQAPSKSV